MGVTGLFKLISGSAPQSISTLFVSQLSEKFVIIDASLFIHQLAQVGFTRDIKVNSTYINHIQGLFHRTAFLLRNNIYPVYVFDGAPPKLKEATLVERRLTNKDKPRVTAEMYTECIKVLTLMGVQVVFAPSEAEAQCALLNRQYPNTYVATEDIDAVVFGATAMIRGLDSRAKSVTLIQNVPANLQLSMQQFIDLAILLGTDYTDKIKGMGPKTALALIRSFNNIEGILASGKVLSTTEGPISNELINNVRNEFINPRVDYEVKLIQPKKLNDADIKQLEEFLVQKGLDKSRFTKALNVLKK